MISFPTALGTRVIDSALPLNEFKQQYPLGKLVVINGEQCQVIGYHDHKCLRGYITYTQAVLLPLNGMTALTY